MDVPVHHLVPEIVTEGMLASKQQPIKWRSSLYIPDEWFVSNLIDLAKLCVAKFLKSLPIKIYQLSVKPQRCPTLMPILIDLAPRPVAEKLVNAGLARCLKCLTHIAIQAAFGIIDN